MPGLRKVDSHNQILIQRFAADRIGHDDDPCLLLRIELAVTAKT